MRNKIIRIFCVREDASDTRKNIIEQTLMVKVLLQCAKKMKRLTLII